MSVSLVGKRIKYRYENGWEYHVHYESETRVSYDVVSGPFGSRHAYQQARYAEVAPNVFMIGWYEETGTIVVQVVNLNSILMEALLDHGIPVVSMPPSSFAWRCLSALAPPCF
jgi:phenolic acid decarboxylase